jgi:hypothetical protein
MNTAVCMCNSVGVVGVSAVGVRSAQRVVRICTRPKCVDILSFMCERVYLTQLTQ